MRQFLLAIIAAFSQSVSTPTPAPVPQHKIWTWNPPVPGDTRIFRRAIVATGSDAAGDTAFVLGESFYAGSNSSGQQYRIAWINAKGVVLKDELLDAEGEDFDELLNLKPNSQEWQVVSVTANSLVVTRKSEVRTYTLKGSVVSLSTRQLESDPIVTDVIKPTGKQEFSGWYERKSQVTDYYIPESELITLYDILEISAWAEK